MISMSFKQGPFPLAGGFNIANRQKMMKNGTALLRLNYPTYSSTTNALSISRPPLVRVRFANLIRNSQGGSLLCAMKSVTFDPSWGFTGATFPAIIDDKILPKEALFSIELRVLHEQTIGWEDGTNKWMGGQKWGPMDTDITWLSSATLEAIQGAQAAQTSPDDITAFAADIMAPEPGDEV